MSGADNRSNSKILTAYRNRNFRELGSMNLDSPINSNGETILHIICKTHDREALKALVKLNPTSLRNALNKKELVFGDTPIHCAVKSVVNVRKDDGFIDELIASGADVNIKNNSGMVVARNSSGSHHNITSNKETLSGSDILNNLKSFISSTSSNNSNPYVDFIAKITDYYIQKGGHHDDSDFETSDLETDYFKYDDYTTYQSRIRFQPETIDAYNRILTRIMEIMGVDEATAKLYRSALKWKVGEKNPELRKKENDALKVKEIEKILEKEKDAKKIMKEIDLDAIKKIMEEQRLKSEEFRKQRDSNKDNRKDSDDKKEDKKDRKDRKEDKKEGKKSTKEMKSKDDKTTKYSADRSYNKYGYLMTSDIEKLNDSD